MQTRVIPTSEPEAFKQAVEILQDGGTVGFPTDTVYGLGASAFDPIAIEQLYAIKERDRQQPIAVLIASTADLEKVAARLNPSAQALAAVFWPGGLTLVVPRHLNLPEDLSPFPTIGVRIPDHADALRLLELSGPLAATSANLSGGTNPHSAADVLAQLDGRVGLVLDGGVTPGSAPSTVVDVSGEGWTVLREGAVTEAQLREVLD